MFKTQIIHSERYRRLINEGFWIILGQATAVIGTLVGVRILTSLLDPSSYGELALGMTVATLVNQTILGPIGNGVIRFYAPAVEHGDYKGYLNAVRRMVQLATGVIVAMILFVDVGLLISSRTEWIAITTAAFIYSIFSGYNSILSGIQNAARQRSFVALHQGLEPWGRYVVAAGLILWLGATSTVALVGYTVAVFIVTGSQFLFFKSPPPHETGKGQEIRWSERMWAFSWPISAFGFFTWMQVVSDRWALKLFSSTYNVGQFAALYQLGYYPISIATGMAMQLLIPILYQRAGDASNHQRNINVSKLSWRITSVALAFTGSAFLIALVFHSQIFRILVGRQYLSVSYLFPWMLLAGGIFAAGQALALNLQSQMRTREMMMAKIITALIGTLLNLAGAYWFGTYGIVIAGVLFSVSYFIYMASLSIFTGGRH